ncbi:MULTISPECIES: TetR/AcrR family transcriptional regulator [unclassified Crossiella]|uniref:TetR/AcrR family transcriptional regulator n=1 Tax=unclassified Crossiella TaxID=2620835 RepID=UPI001FFF52D2|nr:MULTISPECIES: TetR/AcrR family transcriptional regulator [unclassified Crossiella]MCK2237010.1 TetR/AcrR family transcriptional regulator [Crossiella sp. S99.2]MCK2250678.1 TetR/AcrR family transcriptional regulator [Crossiella sp. S99.1]
MPAPFDERDRARIRAELLASGRELFVAQGLRKTSLAELTASAGIAKTSFYAFFAAKESLYCELMLANAPAIRSRLLSTLDGEPRAAIGAFLRAVLAVLDEDPLYRRLITHPAELAAVTARLSPERAAELHEQAMLPIGEFLARTGLTGRRPEVVLGLLRAVLLLPLHRTEFGAVYDEVTEQLIEFVATGLTR